MEDIYLCPDDAAPGNELRRHRPFLAVNQDDNASPTRTAMGARAQNAIKRQGGVAVPDLRSRWKSSCRRAPVLRHGGDALHPPKREAGTSTPSTASLRKHAPTLQGEIERGSSRPIPSEGVGEAVWLLPADAWWRRWSATTSSARGQRCRLLLRIVLAPVPHRNPPYYAVPFGDSGMLIADRRHRLRHLDCRALVPKNRCPRPVRGGEHRMGGRHRTNIRDGDRRSQLLDMTNVVRSPGRV